MFLPAKNKRERNEIMKTYTVSGGIIRQSSSSKPACHYFLIRSLTPSGEIFSVFAIDSKCAAFYYDLAGASRARELFDSLVRGGVSPALLDEVLEEL